VTWTYFRCDNFTFKNTCFKVSHYGEGQMFMSLIKVLKCVQHQLVIQR